MSICCPLVEISVRSQWHITSHPLIKKTPDIIVFLLFHTHVFIPLYISLCSLTRPTCALSRLSVQAVKGLIRPLICLHVPPPMPHQGCVCRHSEFTLKLKTLFWLWCLLFFVVLWLTLLVLLWLKPRESLPLSLFKEPKKMTVRITAKFRVFCLLLWLF